MSFVFKFIIFSFSFSFSNSARGALPPSRLDASKDAIVDLHNEKRGQVKPPASDMKQMQWDDGLARLAQRWSEGCLWEHGDPPEKTHTIGPDGKAFGNAPLGQNLASGSPSNTWKKSIEAWYNEHFDYDFCTNKKMGNGMTGHYTQVVWENSTYVGCGKAICPSRGDYITCNYWPAGNIIGRRPYRAKPGSCQHDSRGGGTESTRSRIGVVAAFAIVVAALNLGGKRED